MILSTDPTAVDPETLDALRVVETIKEGQTIVALTEAEMKRGGLMIAPEGKAEASFAATLRGLGLARDLGAALVGPAASARRRAALAAPHDAGCVADVLTDVVLAGLVPLPCTRPPVAGWPRGPASPDDQG